MRSKAVLDSPRLREMRKKRRKIVRTRIAIIGALFLVAFISLGFVARIKDVNIKSVSITGNKLVESKDIESFTWDILRGHFLWLYPKSNIMIYPEKELKSKILDHFKRIESVEVTSSPDLAISINVKERGAKYVWCNENKKCFFTDEYGYIFDEAPYFSGPVYLKFQGGINSDELPIGQTVAGLDFAKLASFAETIKSFGLEPTIVDLINENETEIFLISSNETEIPKIILNRKNDLNRIIENLRTAVESDPLRTEIKEKYSSLQYIDLRFENKVYYKFK